MTLAARALLACGLGLVAAFVVACGSSSSGGSGLLSQAQSATIAQELATVQSAIRSGECKKSRAGLNELNSSLSGLPASVNQKLVRTLGQGLTTLRPLASRACDAAGAAKHTSTTSSGTSTTVSTPTTTPSTSTPSTPTTTPSTPTPSTPSVPVTPSTPTQVGTGTVTTLSSTTTNGGAGLGGGGTK